VKFRDIPVVPSFGASRRLEVSVNGAGSGIRIRRGVAPGDYKSFGWESIQAFAHVNSVFMANYENRGKPVHVVERGTATTELTLIPVVSK
jgi:hypothetical protein